MTSDDGSAEPSRLRGRLSIASLALLCGLSFQGSRGLYESTEGRYAEAAREMLSSGAWLEPRLHGRPHWSKPPLAYWGMAGGMLLLGRNAWGARLCGALCHAGTSLAAGALGGVLWGEAAGTAAGLVYASSPFPVFGANALSTDALLTLWETLAVLLFLKIGPGRRGRACAAGMWFSFGLGFMTKGPPALLALIPLSLWNRRRAAPVRLWSWAGLAVFAAAALPWYLYVCARHPGLWGYFLGREVVGRVASPDFHRNPEWYKPLVEYFPPLVLGGGVWLAGAVPAWRDGGLRPARLWSCLRRGDAAGFLALWIALPLAVFCLSRSRLPLYVLPLFVPVSLFLAKGVLSLGPRRLRVLALAQALALAAFKGAAARFPSKSDMARLDRAIRAAAPPGAEVLGWEESRLFGLEFYRDGRLRRISAADAHWADLDPRSMREEVRARPSAPRVFVVSPAREASLLESLAFPPEARARRAADKFWAVWVTGD
jgi:4-amino-4-deoxy-L-arabinose transferase